MNLSNLTLNQIKISAKIQLGKLLKHPDWMNCHSFEIEEKKEWTGSFPQKLTSIFKITYERNGL